MTTTHVACPQHICRRADDTALPRPVPSDGMVLHQRIAVASRSRDAPLNPEDALRVGVMRRIAAARLTSYGLGDLVEAAIVLVSELCTNALLHTSATEIALNLEIRDGFLRVTVDDGEPGFAELRSDDDPDAESGRGLILVQHLVAEHGGQWGTRRGGAETWCTLALPSGMAT